MHFVTFFFTLDQLGLLQKSDGLYIFYGWKFMNSYLHLVKGKSCFTDCALFFGSLDGIRDSIFDVTDLKMVGNNSDCLI